MTRKPHRQWLVLAVLIALAGLLRFYKLDGQLWLDEVSALTGSYRNSFWQILTVFPEHFPHPLYEQLAHGSLVSFGESPFAIRLPAAIFGLASVFMFYRLSRRLSGEGEALLGAGLLAVSYHHIYFSQNARGYTLYLFLALAATDLLLSLLKEMRWRTALAYIGVAALAAYSQTAGITLAPGQLLVALVVVCSMRTSERANLPKPWHLIVMFVLTTLLILLLYAPIIGDSVGYTSAVAGDEAPVARSTRIFDVIVEVVRGIGAGVFERSNSRLRRSCVRHRRMGFSSPPTGSARDADRADPPVSHRNGGARRGASFPIFSPGIDSSVSSWDARAGDHCQKDPAAVAERMGGARARHGDGCARRSSLAFLFLDAETGFSWRVARGSRGRSLRRSDHRR